MGKNKAQLDVFENKYFGVVEGAPQFVVTERLITHISGETYNSKFTVGTGNDAQEVLDEALEAWAFRSQESRYTSREVSVL